MRIRRWQHWLALTVAGVTLAATSGSAGAVGNVITFQGQLHRANVPHTGPCDFRFQLFNQPVGGSLVSPLLQRSVDVANGVFTVDDLDFGSVFNGADVWMQVDVHCAQDPAGVFTPLGSRQALRATPDALFAASIADNTVDASNIVDGSVGTAELAAGAVTDAKVASGIDYTKLIGAPTQLPPTGAAGGALGGTYPSPTLAANSVGGTQLAPDAVTSGHIADGNVGTQDLAAGAVTDAKVASGIAYTKLSGAPTSLPPSGAAGGALAGNYPNPTLAVPRTVYWGFATGPIDTPHQPSPGHVRNLNIPTAGTYVIVGKVFTRPTTSNAAYLVCQLVAGGDFDQAEAALTGGAQTLPFAFVHTFDAPGVVELKCSDFLPSADVKLRFIQIIASRVDGLVSGALSP
jgi:hypothetical protein